VKLKEHDDVMTELARNGLPHVRIDGGGGKLGGVREEDVGQFFEGFKVDKVH
jgi:hypothetical protein